MCRLTAKKWSVSQVRLAVFASGKGTNAARIFEYFSYHKYIQVVLVVCNRKEAGVLEVAKKAAIPSVLCDSRVECPQKILQVLTAYKVDFIVLAGFLRLIPIEIIQKFEEKILNIHPALLPKYGGKGMYGKYAHAQVLQDQAVCTGITIHLVNEKYDQGKILFQASVPLSEHNRRTVQWLAERVSVLEQQHYPRVILETIEKTICSQRTNL